MSNDLPESGHDLHVLVVAPTGKDAHLICALLMKEGIHCTAYPTSETALARMDDAAGALIVAEEVFMPSNIALWGAKISAQPSWSDFPLIVLTVAGAVDPSSQKKMLFREPLGNVVLLERPIRPETLISTVQASLRSRRRQYQMRDDLAHRRKTEEALLRSEKLAVAGRLAASIAHEINNPLESVTNLLFLIGTSSSLEESKIYSATAMDELARVSEIAIHTLKFFRQLSKPTTVYLTELVDSALVLYQARLISACVAVQKEYRACPPITAMAGELRQVIVNLVGNAVDAMRGGGTLKIRIDRSTERSNGSRPGMRLTIADSGSGIPAEIKSRLFEPFTSSKGETGTGLGLWVSSEIIRKHGGTIKFKSSSSTPSTGTVFSIFLPALFHFAELDNAEETSPIELLA
ncbi:MAG: hybrid sensor histidine kinase/response regulator [Acidobacteriia bacterium]|nr:hybrid sensor histidine kinase/response regulator [Terriglobia bacterium]